MKVIKNILLTDRHERPIATDIHFNDGGDKRPTLIYAHGFNGFKDWGAFDLIAKQFVEAGFTVIKFNFAFNGTTPQTPEDFTDLPAFGENNYTKELDNLQAVIDWTASADNAYAPFIDAEKLGLIGHSMGGGVVLIKTSEEPRIKAVATWASVSECKTPWGSWPSERIAAWKDAGVEYVENTRTRQQMPLGYQLYEDYQNNKERLSIEAAIKRIKVPILLIHGTADTSVPVASAHRLKEWQPAAALFTLDTDHVFGRKHPWSEEYLKLETLTAIDKTVAFFGKVFGLHHAAL
jgi:dienelactone hydrolase